MMIALSLTACATPTPEMVPATFDAPTLSPFFEPRTPSVAVRPTRTPIEWGSRTLIPGSTSVPSSTIASGRKLVDVFLYDDALADEWLLDAPSDAVVDLGHTSRAYSGERCIAITPQGDYRRILLGLRPESEVSYPAERVAGVRLAIGSGENGLDPTDMAITVLGSNAYSHWVDDDDSVTIDQERFFSESRLYYFGVSQRIPPDSWFEVEIDLGDLPYQPEFEYLTALYVKNDAGFYDTFYLDDIRLLIVEGS
jgi:hypothetical protein